MKFLAFLIGLALCAGSVLAAEGSQSRVASMEEFEAMSAQTEGDLFLKFLIDRHDNKTFLINSKQYAFHSEFARSLFPNLSTDLFNEQTYFTTNRRFVAGTIGWHDAIKKFTIEFWEGDRINKDLLDLTLAKLREAFFEKKLAFKPNSPLHEELARTLTDVEIITSDDLYANLKFKVYNTGHAIGRLRVLAEGENPEDAYFDSDEIVLLNTIPSDITPVVGIIATKFSTPLSHMNLRSYAWKIPNMVLKDVSAISRYAGQMVYFRCDPKGYEVRPPTQKELNEWSRSHRPPPVVRLEADLKYKEMPDLGQMTKKDAFRVGSKNANLSELVRRGGLNIPKGFSVPFYWYQDFLKANHLGEKISSMLTEKKFREDPAYRRAQLKAIQGLIKAGEHTAAFKKKLLAKIKAEYAGKGLFVRSSTNSEDLPGFNGAGLYDSVPNCKTEQQILDGVKVVWSSVFNWKAYQERQHAGIDHLTVQPAVLVLASLDAKAAGVMITTDIYDAAFPESFTINAKKGLGISVVDGKSIPEQVIFDPYYDTIKVITRSEDKIELVVGPDGGIIERPVTNREPVLSPDDVRALGAAGARVREIFQAEGVQDVEWVVAEIAPGQRAAWIVQARPYLGGGTAQAPATVANTVRPASGPKPVARRRK